MSEGSLVPGVDFVEFDCVFVVFERRLALGKDWREICFRFGVIFEFLDEDVPFGSERLERGGIGSFDRVDNHEKIKIKGFKNTLLTQWQHMKSMVRLLCSLIES